MFSFTSVGVFPANSLLEKFVDFTLDNVAITDYLNSSDFDKQDGATFFCEGHPSIEQVIDDLYASNYFNEEDQKGVVCFVANIVYAKCENPYNMTITDVAEKFRDMVYNDGVDVLYSAIVVIGKCFKDPKSLN